jgi:hypothetical protein
MRVDYSFAAHIDGFLLFYHITPIYVVASVTSYMLHFPVIDGLLVVERTGVA